MWQQWLAAQKQNIPDAYKYVTTIETTTATSVEDYLQGLHFPASSWFLDLLLIFRPLYLGFVCSNFINYRQRHNIRT